LKRFRNQRQKIVKAFLQQKLQQWDFETGTLNSSTCPFSAVSVIRLEKSIPLLFKQLYTQIGNKKQKIKQEPFEVDAMSPIRSEDYSNEELKMTSTKIHLPLPDTPAPRTPDEVVTPKRSNCLEHRIKILMLINNRSTFQVAICLVDSGV
jgi:hypothetical protein